MRSFFHPSCGELSQSRVKFFTFPPTVRVIRRRNRRLFQRVASQERVAVALVAQLEL